MCGRLSLGKVFLNDVQGWSVRQTERVTQKMIEGRAAKHVEEVDIDPNVKAAIRELEAKLGFVPNVFSAFACMVSEAFSAFASIVSAVFSAFASILSAVCSFGLLLHAASAPTPRAIARRVVVFMICIPLWFRSRPRLDASRNSNTRGRGFLFRQANDIAAAAG